MDGESDKTDWQTEQPRDKVEQEYGEEKTTTERQTHTETETDRGN